ncbi:MAG: bifunctional ornithine acetyltransferase/N-acetylglutamate synthase [Alkalispirochaeta sp.]
MAQSGCDPATYFTRLENETVVPRGFRFFSDSLTFVPDERPASNPLGMNVSAVVSDEDDTRAVGVTTQNRFPGAPVRLARERLPGGRLRGVVVNNRVSNVATPAGYHDAVTIADTFARAFSLPETEVLSVSTGVIGWSLPVEEMVPVITGIADHEVSPAAFARGIMTTDRYPKLASAADPGGPRILGVAKGAGMIEPDMATMLAFFVTDAIVDATVMDHVFRRVVDETFNTISVDSDQSTSDMVILLANGASGVSLDADAFEALLRPRAEALVEDIVRNGEGTAHVIEVSIAGVRDRRLAREIGKHIVNSPLVKTAIYGNDPNVGRILAACGDALHHLDRDETIDPSTMSIAIFGEEVYRDGAFHLDGARERRLSEALIRASFDPAFSGCPQPSETVDIVIAFGDADRAPAAPPVRVLGSDLSYEYVRENADYRS